MVLNNLTPLAGLTFRRHHIPRAHASGYTLLPLRGANRMRFARYFGQRRSMTAGISLIPGKTGAHRAPLQLLDPIHSRVGGQSRI